MLSRLDELADYKYYFQFTLTCYGKDVESNLPSKTEQIIPTFQALSEKIGSKRVIWRYDPILFTAKYNPEYHLKAFEQMGTSYAFLREIMPQYAVISVGEGNEYGHPTEEVLSRLRDAEVETYRTDLQGHVVCVSDGTDITFKVEKNADADTLALSTSGLNSASGTVLAPNSEPNPDPIQEPANSGTGAYAVNGRNGKIHMNGACPATGTGDSAMKNPVYFDTYEEAENYSKSIDEGLEKRKCGNCW